MTAPGFPLPSRSALGRWRLLICFLAGALLGVALGWSGQVAAGHHQWSGSRPFGDNTAVQGALSLPPSSSALPKTRRSKREEAAANWQEVAADLQDPNVDPDEAELRLLSLNAEAVGQLAAQSVTWPRTGRNDRALLKVFRRWGELAPLSALAAAGQADAFNVYPNQGVRITTTAVEGFIAADPAGAATYLARDIPAGTRGGFGYSNQRDDQLADAIGAWAAQDPAAATRFLEGVHRPRVQGQSYGQVASAWAEQDPVAALAWAGRLAKDGDHASGEVVRAWAKNDFQSAFDYVTGLSGDAKGRLDMLGGMLDAWAGRDPEEAARWTLAQSGEVQTAGIDLIGRRWAESNPAAAAAWSAQLPESVGRQNVWETVASHWAGVDAPATARWMETLPEGAEQQEVFHAYVLATFNLEDHSDSLRWILRDTNLDRRDELLVSSLNNWLKLEPTAARQWIGQHSLPPTVTGKLAGN